MDVPGNDDVLDPLAKKIGIPRDMEYLDNSLQPEVFLVFFIGEALCLVCSVLYYKFLPAHHTSATIRHAVALALGLAVGMFSFGWQFCHVLAQAILCHVALMILPSTIMHLGVFVLAMGYLISIHVYRAYIIPADVLYSIDVSGPLMIATQKITSLAFSIYDGGDRNKDSLSDLRKRYRISKPPSVLEYYSYIFYFQGIVVGPLCFYKDYIAYVEGTDVYEKSQDNNKNNNNNNHSVSSKRPSPFPTVGYKLCISVCWMLFHFTMKPLYPELRNSDELFISNHGILYRTYYMMVSMMCCRAKYYVAFTLGDAICNAAGLGFNGYNSEGKAKWDLITNVHIMGIEFATSFKLYIDNWNIQTAVWLRHVCYDRVPFQKRFTTFLLSALWHGCYPGYYFTFVMGVPFSEVGRKVRRKVRPYFQGSRQAQVTYDVLTWFFTHLAMSYMVVPFTILHLRETVLFYSRSFYWVGHIICALLFFLLPYLPSSRSQKDLTNNDSKQHDISEAVLNGRKLLSEAKKSL